MSSFRWKIIVFSFVVLPFMISGETSAVMIKKQTLADLTSRAGDILRVRCIAQYHGRAETGTNIYTFYTFEIKEKIKGGIAFNDRFVLRFIGGRSGGTVMIVPGGPSFAENRQYVLYLNGRNEIGYPLLVGYTQGIIPLTKTPLGALVISRNEILGLIGPDVFIDQPEIPYERFRQHILNTALPSHP